MSRYTDAKYEEYRLKIRRMLQLRPKLTAVEVSERLKIDYKMAKRLLKKVETDKIMRLKRAMKDDDLSEIVAFIDEASPEIKRIIFSQGSADKDKIAAFKAVIDGKGRELDLKMDTGIYARSLGKIVVEDKLNDKDKDLLKKALLYATERGRIGQNKPKQGTPKGTGE